MAHYETEKDGYFITCDHAKMDADVIHQYLSQESYWAKGIPKEVVVQSIANSLCFGIFYQGKQIGFARLITDKATFAYLADVFVLEAQRGKGLSKWLMQTIHGHPDVQTLRRWVLGTMDAHTLYEQFGWKRFTDDVSKRFMQKYNPDIYNLNPAHVG
jgi:GNAT superfamily N-acetyltransferase